MTTSEEERNTRLVREVKAGRNQSLFREVNERLKEVGEHSRSLAYEDDAICECADEECSERISINHDEYEALRRHSTWFVVCPSDEHVFADVERVLERGERYWIIEKLDQAAAVAKKHDPRRSS